jgi:TRAP-type C4-dicarboxylate transport system substrate-binding protein
MKKIGFLSVCLFILLGFFCAPSYAKVLRVNEELGPGSPEALALEKFKELVEKRTNGDLEIRIYLQAQLGNPQTTREMLMTGTLDLSSSALSLYESMAPDELRVTTLLWFLKDRQHFRNYLKSEVFKKALNRIQNQGIRFISTEWSGERGPYRVYVSKKPIIDPEDLNGVKMRIWANEAVKRCWSHMGCVPIVISWNEVYLSLKQGMIQAMTAPLALLRRTRFTEVARYVTETKQFVQVWPIAISEKVWQKLPPDQQKILVDSANEACEHYSKVTRNAVEKDIQAMVKENNAVFIRVNTEPFEKKMLTLFPKLVEEGYIKKDIFDAVEAMR